MSMDTQLDLHLHARRRPTRSGAGMGVAGSVQGLALVAVIVAGVLGLVLDGNDVSWLAGLSAGAGAAAALTLRGRWNGLWRRAPAPGPATAERRTATAVRTLESAGWRFVHDVPGPDGPYDHIAVGPGGLILLESLSPAGVVTMDAGQLVVERRATPPAPLRRERLRPQARPDAITLRESVQRIARRRLWVQAVVVLWSEFPAGCVADGRCVYIHGSRLVDWMTRRPHQLDEAEVDEVFAAVQALAEQAGSALLPVAV